MKKGVILSVLAILIVLGLSHQVHAVPQAITNFVSFLDQNFFSIYKVDDSGNLKPEFEAQRRAFEAVFLTLLIYLPIIYGLARTLPFFKTPDGKVISAARWFAFGFSALAGIGTWFLFGGRSLFIIFSQTAAGKYIIFALVWLALSILLSKVFKAEGWARLGTAAAAFLIAGFVLGGLSYFTSGQSSAATLLPGGSSIALKDSTNHEQAGDAALAAARAAKAQGNIQRSADLYRQAITEYNKAESAARAGH